MSAITSDGGTEDGSKYVSVVGLVVVEVRCGSGVADAYVYVESVSVSVVADS